MVVQTRFLRTSRVGAWIALGRENMVRLVDFEDLLWELNTNISNCKIAYCSSGGPLALYSGGRLNSDQDGNHISLYNSKGAPHPVTSSIRLEGIESVLYMCWNESNDNLIVVLNTGEIRFFNLKGELTGTPIRLSLPLLYINTGNGIALVTNDKGYSLTVLECKQNGDYRTSSLDIPNDFKIQKPNVMLAIPQQFSDTGYTEIFIPFLSGENTSSFYHCVFNANSRCYDLRLSIDGGNVTHMSLSPSAQSIAFLVQDGTIYVTSRSFEDVTRLLNIETEVLPAQFIWCGDKCITYLHLTQQFDENLDFPTTLTLINVDDSSQSDFLNDIPTDSFLVSDCDGIRILSQKTYQFLQVVSEPSRRIFSVGSRANSAMLLLAFDEFMCGNASSVKMIRDLQKNSFGLSNAIDDCVAAAGFEFEVSQQKRLMRVAAFGKSFCSMYESDVFVNMARRLRVLNTLRRSKAGMLMSQAQLLSLEGDRLAERLVQMNHHQLAYYVCEILGYSTQTVMTEWALAKLGKHFISINTEKEIAYNIAKKLKEFNQKNFSEIAYKAYLKERPHAALIFLEAENIPTKQVARLLDIKQPEIALSKAIKSGNTDLLFTVMMYLINNKGANAIPLLTSDFTAQSMLLVYVTVCESNRDLLVEYFRTHPEYNTYLNILHYLKEEQRSVISLNRKNSNWEMLQEIKLSAIQSAAITAKREIITNVGNNGGTFGSAISHSISVAGFPTSNSSSSSQGNEKWLRAQMQLLNEQTKLMKQLNDKRFLDASVAKTITLCYEYGQNGIAERLKNEFGVSEKMHSWCMLNAYSATCKWDLIDQIGGVKNKTKPIIGASAFVTKLLACDRPEQAKLYISKVPQIEQRMEFYVLCNDWMAAGADCRRHGEPEMFAQLKERAKGNVTAIHLIEEGWNSGQESGVLKFTKLFT
ncbi:putative vacuolar protein sorting complex subunit [Trypanosoma theileri]|uniref:Putative vacuolar protein sorting complex subunit n=1 Tax=Trypanosoma theileri TaxID=67003 RepID=A0A1X0P6Z7_9TRYP|nr:putative vacuolar protein sorting complex subunit [Trypanosoma theileri]ORC92702.1 putative vacuolar protein sorting complex subunit [Trypanosoma theileri]